MENEQNINSGQSDIAPTDRIATYGGPEDIVIKQEGIEEISVPSGIEDNITQYGRPETERVALLRQEPAPRTLTKRQRRQFKNQSLGRNLEPLAGTEMSLGNPASLEPENRANS